MDKNWLIRTKKKQILGPVSKQKIIDFVNKGALGADDEISSGNGYWFQIKESDLMDRYLFGDLLQPFNPITEAPNVLTKQDGSEGTSSFKPQTAPLEDQKNEAPSLENEEASEEVILPDEEELDYPDMEVSAPTLSNIDSETGEEVKLPDEEELDYPDMDEVVTAPVASSTPAPTPEPVSLSLVEEAPPAIKLEEEEVVVDEEALYPIDTDLEYPEVEAEEKVSIEEPKEEVVEELDSPAPIKKKKKKVVTKKKKVSKKSKANLRNRKGAQRNDNYLIYALGFMLAITLFGVYYYYKNILKKPLPFIGQNISLIRSVSAQSIVPITAKKKSSRTTSL